MRKAINEEGKRYGKLTDNLSRRRICRW